MEIKANKKEPYLCLISENNFKSGEKVGKLTIEFFVTRLEPTKLNPEANWFLFLNTGINYKLMSHYKFRIEDTRLRVLGNLARDAFGALKKVLENVSAV